MKLLVIKRKYLVWMLVGLATLLVAVSPWTPPSKFVATQNKELPIYSVDNDKKEIAITFDSAWGNEDLESILQTLKTYQCPATFFVVGDFIDRYPDSVKAMAEGGHQVANHSNSHAHFNALSRESMIADMDACDAKIKQITGRENNLFRAPYGEYNTLLVRTCNETKRYCMQWDTDSLDWKGLTPEEMQKRVMDKVKSGSILLFHNGAPHTATALPQILNELKNQGYTFKTVSDLIYKDNYYMDAAGRQIKRSEQVTKAE